MKLRYKGSKFDYTIAGIDRSLVPGETVDVLPDLGTVLIATGVFESLEPLQTIVDVVVSFDTED